MSVQEKNTESQDQIATSGLLGEHGALANGLEAFRHTHSTIPWTRTLVSALETLESKALAGDLTSARAAAWCLWHLRPRVDLFVQINPQIPLRYLEGFTPDSCDSIAAALTLWSRLPWTRKTRYLESARTYAMSAFARTGNDADGHLHGLVSIRLAQIEHALGDVSASRVYLATAEKSVKGAVMDANERSRIYRGIALMIVQIYGIAPGNKAQALKALDAADAIPGIRDDVRAMNAEVRQRIESQIREYGLV